MDSCVEKILSFLADGVISQGAYVIRYNNHVQLLERENRRLGEKKDRILEMVDRATNHGKVIEADVSSWLEEVEQMEGDIANFLRQQENGESFRCFPGCMCPNLIWRRKRGIEAEKRKSEVGDLISRGEGLQTSPVARNASFQSEPHFDSPHYYTTFPSRASVFAKIMNALKDSGVHMIGVHGPGGAGKTTMVKKIANEAKKLGIFDKIVLAVVSKDPNISTLQEDIEPQLELEYERTNELGRADELRKALLNSKRKILVILDDLWQVLDLKAIGIPISGLGDKGCKIMLTSRKEEVFELMNVRSFFVIEYLKEQEAWELFTKVTGNIRVDELTAREVCKKCADLPITVVALGSALKDKEVVEWRNALHELEKSPLKYIEGVELVGYTPLKLSYDFLKDEAAKSCFLLCCLFPEDAEISIDDLVRYSFALGFLRRVDTLKDARIKVQAIVNKLKRSCLLLNGATENFVKMHDVIRDLAISIAEEKQTGHGGRHDWPGKQQFKVDHNIRKWPENDAWKHHTAISLRINDDNINFPSGVLHCPLMHTLVLKRGKSPLQIPNDFFQGMKGARVLDLKDILMDLPSLVLELDHLRMLRLNSCQLLGDLSTIRNLKNHIEILNLEGSTIKELPQEIGELTRLQSLNLRECKSLKVIPKGVISNLINLEELYVTNDFKEWDTTVYGGGMSNASVAELKSLSQLIVLRISISAESSRILVQECPDLFEKLINFSVFINAGPFGNGSPGLRLPVARDASFQTELHFRSRASVVEEIKYALTDSGVHMIGVCGPAGGGKTMMAIKVAEEAKELGIFDKIVIAVASKDPNTSKLQEELALQLDLKYDKKSDSGKAAELRKALLNRKRKILVILDDLWQRLDLNAIGIPISGPGHKGCKILLTSRNEEVFKRMNVHSYFSIGYLTVQEAWELFTKVTGDFGVDESIAREVSERCGGLPIAIAAVGAALKDAEEFEWHNALHKLKNSPLEYIEGFDPMGYTPLKWSYEFLKDEGAKSCFLFCCLFPEDAEIDIDDLVRYSFALGFLGKVDTLKVARNIVQAIVNKLKKSCLLLNGAQENFVKMHDVIRDLAISITEEKQTEHGGGHDWPRQQQFMVNHDIRKWPKNDAWKHHTAISLRINDDNFPFPCDVLNCPLAHTLVLESGKSSLKIPNNFFQGMKEVKVLDLKGILLDLPSLVLELDYLRMLCLNNCQLLGDMSTIQSLKNCIEILCFKGSTMEELPQEIRELTCLRSLNLMECNSLKVIPKGVISNLINLEELYVTNNFKEWDTPVNGGGMSNASIAELKSLTQLTILHISISAESFRIMVQKYPDLFERLINFKIFITKEWGVFL